MKKQGFNVVITGASSGIGKALAYQFAKKGCNLFLTGRQENNLEQIKREIQTKYAVKVFCFVKDLLEENSELEIYKESIAVFERIHVFVNNAGVGYVGDFLKVDYDKYKEIQKINMESVTKLLYLYGEHMKEKRGGYILNVASTGAFHPGPYISVYYATKAYVLSLSEALYKEWKKDGITVSALCPGATKTGFSKYAGRKENKIAMSANFVAKKAVIGLFKNKRVIIPGIIYKIFIKIPGFIVSGFIGRYNNSAK